MKVEDVVAILKEHENDNLTESSSFCKQKIQKAINNPGYETFTGLKEYLERENPEDETVKEIAKVLGDALKTMAKLEDEPTAKSIVTQAVAIPVPCPAVTASDKESKLITYPAGTKLEIHPAADLYPMQTATGFESLCENIKTQGQHDPIIICRDKIIDGRNRYKACLALNIEINAVEADIPEMQIWELVFAWNILHKQLSSGQRAVIALSERKQLQAEASERMLSGKPCGKNSTGSKTDEILARKYMTNAKYIVMAAEIASNPELLKKVFDGDMDIRAAYHKLKPRPKKKEIPQSTLPRYVLEKLVEFFSPAQNSELEELIAHTSGELKKMLSKKLAELEARS